MHGLVYDKSRLDWSCKHAGVEHCINSDGILELDSVPKRLAIIGAGYIGIEFGGMFNNLGALCCGHARRCSRL